jgi:hypothetical protein
MINMLRGLSEVGRVPYHSPLRRIRCARLSVRWRPLLQNRFHPNSAGLKSASKPRPAETPLPGIGDRGRGAGENVGAPLLRWGTDASGEEGSGVCQDQAGSEHNPQTAQETTFPWSQARQARIQVSIGIIFGFSPATSDLVRWFEACVTATPATRAIIIVSFSHCFTMCVSPFVCAGAFARSWV